MSCAVCQLPASVYCRADDAKLCAACDLRIHSANALASRHERVALEPTPDRVNQLHELDYFELGLDCFGEEGSPDKLQPSDFIDDCFGLDAANWLDRLDTGEFSPPSESDGCVPDLFASSPAGESLALGPNTVGQAAPSWTCSVRAHQPPSYNEEFRTDQLQAPVEVPVPHYSPPTTVDSSSGDDSSSAVVSRPLRSTPPAAIHTAKSKSSAPPLQVTRACHTGDRGSADNGLHMTRAARVERYRQKRKTRKFQKTVRYASRKAYAEQRPRVKGRFCKRSPDEAVVPQVC